MSLALPTTGKRLFLSSALGLCLGVALCLPHPSAVPEASATGQAPSDGPRQDRHALLVGVSFYESLPESKHLRGPANDVKLVRKLLIEKFHFRPDQIVVLSEEEGSRRGKDYLPTRANIAREFERLAKVVKPKDQVVILLGGHGSQQPEDPNSPDPEPDGLDEIFLPRDIGMCDQATRKVPNAIIDDEMGAWLKAIRDAKASVWVTFDCCHSGTMIRGGSDDDLYRKLDPIKDLGIPEKAIKEAVALAAKREAKNGERSRGGETAGPLKLAKEGGIVAIYACQPHEVTFEGRLPLMCADAKSHGILTYALCAVLTEAAENSTAVFTYSELVRRIQAYYLGFGKTSPTVLIEGTDRDRQVLGDQVWPGRSSMWLTIAEDGALKINAGALQGLTRGSILAVYAPPGKGTTLMGHVRIEELGTLESKVKPCAHDGKPAVAQLPEDGVCKAVMVDVGDQQLKVAVDSKDAEGKAVAKEAQAALSTALKGLGGQDALIQHVDKTSQADWLVRLQGQKVVLVPAAGWMIGRDAVDEKKRFGPVPNDDRVADWLRASLETIARGENLKRLAAAESGAATGVRLDIKLLRRKDSKDKVGTFPLAWPGPTLAALDGDLLLVKLTNKGRTPIDVTLLYVDSAYGIDCLYPAQGQLNRLEPGESESVKLKVTSKTVGHEHFVAIAVKANGQPVDYSLFAQPSLNQALARGGDGVKQVLQTPLGKLLQRGIYGQGTSRSVTRDEQQEYAMTIIPMHIQP